MRKLLSALLVLLCFALFSGCCACPHKKQADCQNCPQGKNQNRLCCAKSCAAAKADLKAQQTQPEVLYLCDFGPDRTRNAGCQKPQSCPCGKPTHCYRILKVEGEELLLCACDGGCQCKLDPDNPNLCACGKPIKRINLKRSGL
ncbi:MAG: hypothetical protein P8X63_06915 [Desulfuromonadaceae bacterium]